MHSRTGTFFQALQVFLIMFVFLVAAVPAWTAETLPAEVEQGVSLTQAQKDSPAPVGKDIAYEAPGNCFIYFIVILVLSGSFLSLLSIRKTLTEADWSLSNALSEGVELTAIGEDGKPIMDASSQPVIIKTMRASSSRMAALMGMIVILLMFIAFGVFALLYFAKTGGMPQSIDRVVKFLAAGLTLFAPYALNKFFTIFGSLAPKT